jgi:hypothetical protein
LTPQAPDEAKPAEQFIIVCAESVGRSNNKDSHFIRPRSTILFLFCDNPNQGISAVLHLKTAGGQSSGALTWSGKRGHVDLQTALNQFMY